MKAEQKQNADRGQEPLELLHKIDQVIEGKFGTQTVIPSSETLSFELHLPTQTDVSAEQAKKLHEEQMAFYLRGHQAQPAKDLLPIHLSDYRKTDNLRYDFPVIIDAGQENWFVPLRQWIDEALQNSGLDGNESTLLKLELSKVEKLLKKALEKEENTSFARALDRSYKAIQKELAKQNGTMASIEKVLADMRTSVSEDSRLIAYGADFYKVFIKSILSRQIKNTIDTFAPDLAYRQSAIQALINSGESAGKSTADGSAAWDSEIDFSKLNKITASLPRNTISAERMKRLKFIASTLSNWLPFTEHDGLKSLSTSLIVNSLAEAKATVKDQKDITAKFFKAYHLAALEMENKYVAEHHDPFFASYGPAMLSEDERKLIPPVILMVDSGFADDTMGLIELLNSGDRVKIFIRETAPLYHDASGAIRPGLAGLFAQMTLNLNQTAVCQSTLATLPGQSPELEAVFDYDGPGLISIFDGITTDTDAKIPAWLLSGMAPEARVFVNFSSVPVHGAGQAERFTLDNTPKKEEAWPIRSFKFIKDGAELMEYVPFSAIEYCAVQPAFATHFKQLNPDEYHDRQVPFIAFINESRYQEEGYLPFISMVDPVSGEIVRVLVDRSLVEAAYHVQENWRMLQEYAGINNSHVERYTARLHSELNAEKEQAIKTLSAEYEQKLNQDRESLTNEIIAGIAAGLVSTDLVQMGNAQNISISTTPAPVVSKSAESGDEEETPVTDEQETEDDEMSFDEAYIDTPLCTSCNECRNQNEQMFLYDDNKQAYIGDVSKGTFKQLVTAAENCPVHIIHPGKPQNPDEADLDDLMERAEKFN